MLLALLSYPALVVRINMGWRHLFILDLFCFLASILPIALYFGTAARQAGISLLKSIAAVPLVMALGIGLCINNGRGALEALLRRRSEFVRTPKFRIEVPGDTWRRKRYAGRSATVQTWIELGLSLYFLGAIAVRPALQGMGIPALSVPVLFRISVRGRIFPLPEIRIRWSCRNRAKGLRYEKTG